MSNLFRCPSVSIHSGASTLHGNGINVAANSAENF